MMNQTSANGWRTWDTRSLLHHVLLPQGVGIRLGLYEHQDGQLLTEAFVGLQSPGSASVRPLGHTPDGSFTQLELSWRGISVRVETASEGLDWVCRVTPLEGQLRPATLVVSGSAPWNLGGWCQPSGEVLKLCWPGGTLPVRVIGEPANPDSSAWNNPTLGAALTGEAWVVAGELDLEGARALLERKAAEHVGLKARFGPMADAFDGMQMCMSWNTIFDPIHSRVISPVSRI